jgi:hypothetical protein
MFLIHSLLILGLKSNENGAKINTQTTIVVQHQVEQATNVS